MIVQEINYEGLELSTQILIKEAVSRGLGVEILDQADNFIRLTKSGREPRVEYIKQATRTSADNYMAPLIMDNKVVTKQLLKEQGLRIPEGEVINSLEQARALYRRFADQNLVIKPNNTNFGKGVGIWKQDSRDQYEALVSEALNYDNTVLIEEFIPGREFRFLIIGDKVVGVLHRVAANVIGDGQSTIEQLIEVKNRHPLRGTGYRKPLQKLMAGEVELQYLKLKGRNFETIPAKGEQVFLRRNSNISTGGDSIDFTDQIHQGYKEIALEAVRAVGARISGADIIIDDITAPPSATNYGIIELNFNPAIHIHTYPYQGENRHPAAAVLDLLGL